MSAESKTSVSPWPVVAKRRTNSCTGTFSLGLLLWTSCMITLNQPKLRFAAKKARFFGEAGRIGSQ